MSNAPFFTMINKTEEHGWQFSNKRAAQISARLETQRTGIKHTLYLTTTFRNLNERMCWTIIPVTTAMSRLAYGAPH
jgi:hypothetical protein